MRAMKGFQEIAPASDRGNQSTDDVFREKSKPRTGRLPTKEKLNPDLARRKFRVGRRD
jgi:hypothetical protein